MTKARIGEETSASDTPRLSGHKPLKRRVYDILTFTDPGDRTAQAVGFSIVTLITLNVVAVILQTVNSLDERYGGAFYYFEMASVIVFSVEYVLRLWSCTCDERYSHPLWGRLRYVITPLAIVDLVAIAPFYALAFLGKATINTAFVRALRLLRLMRLFKTSRYSQSFQIMGRVLRAKKEQILVTVLVVVVVLVVLSSVMYFVEGSAQPDRFSSIPASMWWG